jgi:hypothetical protein
MDTALIAIRPIQKMDTAIVTYSGKFEFVSISLFKNDTALVLHRWRCWSIADDIVVVLCQA